MHTQVMVTYVPPHKLLLSTTEVLLHSVFDHCMVNRTHAQKQRISYQHGPWHLSDLAVSQQQVLNTLKATALHGTQKLCYVTRTASWPGEARAANSRLVCRVCGQLMDFRFPGWSASLHERRCTRPSAHTITSTSEQDRVACTMTTWTPCLATRYKAQQHVTSSVFETLVCIAVNNFVVNTKQEDVRFDSGSAAHVEPIAEWSSSPEKRAASGGALLTALPDALLRQVLSLLPQRAALHAALASRTLREAALSDELWSAWSGAEPPAYLCVLSDTGLGAEYCTTQALEKHCGVCLVLRAAYRKGAFQAIMFSMSEQLLAPLRFPFVLAFQSI